jgi:hypothetical membrane protein
MSSEAAQRGSVPGARSRVAPGIYLPGIVGPVLSIACAWAAARGYRQHDAHYSFLHQTISDLGNLEKSALAVVFNAGLVLGGAGMAVFVLGMRPWLRSAGEQVVIMCSLVAALGMSLIGVIPDQAGGRAAHNIVALVTFLSVLGLSASFAVCLLVVRQEQFPRWLVVPSAFCALCAATFLPLLVLDRLDVWADPHIAFPSGAARPISIVPLLEWLVYLSTLLLSFTSALSVIPWQKAGKTVTGSKLRG